MANRSELLSKQDTADRFDVDVRTITNWVAAGMPYRRENDDVLFAWHDCYKWREKSIREDERALRHAGGDEQARVAMADARLRVAQAEAEEAEISLALRRSETIRVDFMVAEFKRIAIGIRARLLSLPQGWAARMGACTTTVDRLVMLQEMINEVLPLLRELVKRDPSALADLERVTVDNAKEASA